MSVFQHILTSCLVLKFNCWSNHSVPVLTQKWIETHVDSSAVTWARSGITFTCFQHLTRLASVYHCRGTSGIDIDLQKVDIDQCPLPEGTKALNVFAGSDKCKPKTTKVQTTFTTSLLRCEENVACFCTNKQVRQESEARFSWQEAVRRELCVEVYQRPRNTKFLAVFWLYACRFLLDLWVIRGVSTNFPSLANNFVEFCTKFAFHGEGVLGSSCPGLQLCHWSQVSFLQRQETLCILVARNLPREGKFVETPRTYLKCDICAYFQCENIAAFARARHCSSSILMIALFSLCGAPILRITNSESMRKSAIWAWNTWCRGCLAWMLVPCWLNAATMTRYCCNEGGEESPLRTIVCFPPGPNREARTRMSVRSSFLTGSVQMVLTLVTRLLSAF